jgi:uncharacterized protein (AIM24 family)
MAVPFDENNLQPFEIQINFVFGVQETAGLPGASGYFLYKWSGHCVYFIHSL